ncbi:hypothetical protein [Sphaerisporangium aureirubrum]|uniref:Uncharacterized protein n=1 Tax=Sphaerisporangium aureirubrum TaxID=1544736 RepID=A0ABW1NKU2_9ACTN
MTGKDRIPRQWRVPAAEAMGAGPAGSTVEDPEAEAGTVVAVMRPGYGDGPDQLRLASVVASTKAED